MDDQKAVIFDMDGVMVDTEPLYFEANSRTFHQLGVQISPSAYAEFVGLDAHRMWVRIKNAHGLQQTVPELVALEKDGLHRALLDNPIPILPGLPELLDTLLARGLTIGLASSSPFKVINTILDKTRLRRYFSALTSGEEVRHGKPAPDIFLLAAARLEINPVSCTVIEDSGHGVAGAKAAGMKCAAFANPNAGKQDFSPADIILYNFQPGEVARLMALVLR
jgi:beta-phosphoglucomutase family hydrolase